MTHTPNRACASLGLLCSYLLAVLFMISCESEHVITTDTEAELENRNWQLCDNINAPWIIISVGGDCVPECPFGECCVQISFEDIAPATVRVIMAPTGGSGGSGSDKTMTVPPTGILDLCVPSGYTIAVEDSLGCNELKVEC